MRAPGGAVAGGDHVIADDEDGNASPRAGGGEGQNAEDQSRTGRGGGWRRLNDLGRFQISGEVEPAATDFGDSLWEDKWTPVELISRYGLILPVEADQGIVS